MLDKSKQAEEKSGYQDQIKAYEVQSASPTFVNECIKAKGAKETRNWIDAKNYTCPNWLDFTLLNLLRDYWKGVAEREDWGEEVMSHHEAKDLLFLQTHFN